MAKLMNRLYDNIDEAKAFELRFANMAFFYEDLYTWEFHTELCPVCRNCVQSKDLLAPRASCKKPTSMLQTFDMGVSVELKDELIRFFDISEADFRPVRTKKGEIVYFQITPQHVMLPIHEVNEWQVKQTCPACGSVQYHRTYFQNEKKEPYYFISQAALDEMHDLNFTFEQFRWGRREVIVSRRVYDYLSERCPRTHYYPLFLK